MQIHVLGIAAKKKGPSRPPVQGLPRPKVKEQPTKNVVARYEVRQ